MLTKTLLKGANTQFIRYLLVGGWNTVFGMAVYAVLYQCWGDRAHYLLLLVPSNILAITNAYVCYKLIVFKTRGNLLSEYFRCYLVYGGAMFLGAILMSVLVEGLGISPIVANCACITLTTVVSYFAHRDFSFAKRDKSTCTLPAYMPTDRSLLVFYTVLSVAALSHMASMTAIPLPWLDEVHIVEMGRIAFARGSLETSFMMNPDGKGSYLAFYYLGPVLQELTYRVSGFSGVRFLPMLGLLVATVFCRKWLLKKMISPWTATLLSLVLLADPLLTQSIRLVRIDSLAFALCFATLYFLRRSSDLQRPAPWTDFFIAGVLIGGSLFVWPTALLFIFVYLVEFWKLCNEKQLSKRNAFMLLISAGCGACIITFILLFPLVSQYAALAVNLQNYFSGQGVSATVDLKGIAYGIFICTLKEGLRSPFFMLAALLGLMGCLIRIRQYAFLLGSFFVTVILCVRSGLHTFRFIYLFPFFFLFAKIGIQYLNKEHPKWGKGLLAGILVYGFSTSVFAYFGMSLIYKGRSLSAVTGQLRDAIGAGEKRVYSRTLQTYYPARTLGWRHYRYAKDDLILEDDKHANLLLKVDYVIDSEKLSYYAIEESFTLYGLTRNFLIRSAMNMPEDKRTALCTTDWQGRLHMFCANLGRSLASSAVPPKERLLFEQSLLAHGFQKVRVIDLTTRGDAYKPLQRWLLSKQATNPDYDTLVIWKRTATKPE